MSEDFAEMPATELDKTLATLMPPALAYRDQVLARVYQKLNSNPPPGESVHLTAEEFAAFKESGGGLLSGVTTEWLGEDPPSSLTSVCDDGAPVISAEYRKLIKDAPPPPIAGPTIPAPDPAAQPGPEANVIRVFQWPPHCGQWYARVGSPGDRRSIQFGPLRTAAEVLESFAKHLAARGHRFDGGYEPPGA